MTQEEKDLLLRDLCARLPYDCNVTIAEGGIDGLQWNNEDGLEYIKPYLRPMSSMTEEERKEYKHLVAFSGSPDGAANFVDWLNKYHFDYRGLIEKGLAIEVTEENNPYK